MSPKKQAEQIMASSLKVVNLRGNNEQISWYVAKRFALTRIDLMIKISLSEKRNYKYWVKVKDELENSFYK